MIHIRFSGLSRQVVRSQYLTFPIKIAELRYTTATGIASGPERGSPANAIPVPGSDNPQTPFDPGTAGDGLRYARRKKSFMPNMDHTPAAVLTWLAGAFHIFRLTLVHALAHRLSSVLQGRHIRNSVQLLFSMQHLMARECEHRLRPVASLPSSPQKWDIPSFGSLRGRDRSRRSPQWGDK